MYNYIKAYLCFYRQNISVENFKTIAVRDMMPYYKVSTEKDAFMKLLDDMYNKVDYYIMLSDTDKANKLVKNNKFRFYYKIFTEELPKYPGKRIERDKLMISSSALPEGSGFPSRC